MITNHPLHFPLQETFKMMRPPGSKSFANETASYAISGSFPHYKHIMMPPDQKAKLLAMHRASRANAGIYVAVVLGVYLILLTMLLCRYAKRHRPSTDAASLLTAPPGIPPPTPQRSRGIFPCGRCHFTCHFTPASFRTIYKSFLCCCRHSSSSMDESIHEITDYPMTSLASQIDCKERYGKKNKPVPV